MYPGQVAVAAVILAPAIILCSAGTILLLVLAGAVLPYASPKLWAAERALTLLAVVLASFVLGCLWGGVPSSFLAFCEGVMLFAAAPATVGGLAWAKRRPGRPSYAAGLAVLAGFYLGYGAGWLALRGYIDV